MTSRISLSVILSLTVLTALLGHVKRVESDDVDRAGKRHVIEMRQLVFRPSTLIVSPGDTVVWINRDIVPHTATAEDESWDSEVIAPDQSWEMVPTEIGSQSYICSLHPSMVGTLEVR